MLLLHVGLKFLSFVTRGFEVSSVARCRSLSPLSDGSMVPPYISGGSVPGAPTIGANVRRLLLLHQVSHLDFRQTKTARLAMNDLIALASSKFKEQHRQSSRATGAADTRRLCELMSPSTSTEFCVLVLFLKRARYRSCDWQGVCAFGVFFSWRSMLQKASASSAHALTALTHLDYIVHRAY